MNFKFVDYDDDNDVEDGGNKADFLKMNSKITTTSLTPLLDSTVVTPKSPLSPQIPIHIEHHQNGSASSYTLPTKPTTSASSNQLPATQFLFPATSSSSRSSYPEILRPRLSLNGTMTPFRYLSISPRPLLRDSNSKSTQPLMMSTMMMSSSIHDEPTNSSNSMMMATLGGAGNVTGTNPRNRKGPTISTMTATTNRVQSNVQNSSYGAFDDNKTVYSINSNNLNMVENLGSLRRFSIDRHSFLGKMVALLCCFVFIMLLLC